MNKPDENKWNQRLSTSLKKMKNVRFWQLVWNWICRYRVICMAAAVLLVLVIIIVITTGHKSSADAPIQETVTIIGNTRKHAESETILEEGEETQKINLLIERYFNALAICDVETLNNICETSAGFDEEVLAEQAAYIEGYQNLECTIMDGLTEGTYVVYVYYEMKFYYIDTPAPALVQLFVKTDADGTPYIYQGVIDGELSAYIAELTSGEQISSLAEAVNWKLEAACAADADLDALIQILRGENVERMTEDTEGETVSLETSESV